MTLIFVRHGESEGNRQGVVQGWLDSPLTERGRADARAAAERLSSRGATAVYSSDLARARETGEIIAALAGLPLEHRQGLRERSLGEAQGLSWSEIRERWGAGVRAGTGDIPGEEATAGFRERVARDFDLLAGRHSEGLAICAAHGGSIRMVIGHVLGLPPDVYPRVHIANGSLTVVEMDGGRPVLTSLNDACHIAVDGR